MRLLAIVVNYRTPGLALEAVGGLARALEGLPGARVVLLDNASGDGSLERLRAGVAEAGLGERVRVEGSPRNGGFGYGVNRVLRPALAAPDPPEAFYLLNPDAVPAPDAVRLLCDFLAAHPRAGIMGSAIEGMDGVPHTAGFRFPSLASELEGTARVGLVSRLLASRRVSIEGIAEPRPVDWVSGASLLARREVFERVGLFDEGYFLYFEEMDLCRRARAAGFEVWTVPASRVRHHRAASTGFDDVARPRAPWWFASRRRYWRKHHGRAMARLADAVWIAGFASWRLRRRLTGRPDPDPPGLLGDFARHAIGLRPRAGSGAREAALGGVGPRGAAGSRPGASDRTTPDPPPPRPGAAPPPAPGRARRRRSRPSRGRSRRASCRPGRRRGRRCR